MFATFCFFGRSISCFVLYSSYPFVYLLIFLLVLIRTARCFMFGVILALIGFHMLHMLHLFLFRRFPGASSLFPLTLSILVVIENFSVFYAVVVSCRWVFYLLRFTIFCERGPYPVLLLYLLYPLNIHCLSLNWFLLSCWSSACWNTFLCLVFRFEFSFCNYEFFFEVLCTHALLPFCW